VLPHPPRPPGDLLEGDNMTPDCKLLLSPALYWLPGAAFSWVTRVPRSGTTWREDVGGKTV
jgi:hypothetical protein